MRQRYSVIKADFLEWADQYKGPKFHALLTDTPYNMSSVTKRFGGNNKPHKGELYQRTVGGFMGQGWDTDIGLRVSTWEKTKKLLFPGALILAFMSAKKQHRMACAQEDAGLILRPSYHNFQSGSIQHLPARLAWAFSSGKENGTRVKSGDESTDQVWKSHMYSHYNPDIEPIIVCQNPYPYEINSLRDGVTRYGTGAINVENGQKFKVSDRKPGSLFLTHHPGCEFVGCEGFKNGNGDNKEDLTKVITVNTYGKSLQTGRPAKGDKDGIEKIPTYNCHTDCKVSDFIKQGGDKRIDRYFAQFDWNFEALESVHNACPLIYCPKPRPKERNAFLDGSPDVIRQRANAGGLQNDPKWANTIQKNNHPTLKPIMLTMYLASLVLPPPEFYPRRILVPFCGSGSEMAGCLLAGWDEVVGIDDNGDYVNIANPRLAGWLERLKEVGPDIGNILACCRPDGSQKENKKQLILL